MKNIYLFVGASGSGKTAITDMLESKYKLVSVQSYATRKPRSDDEASHIFVTDEEFKTLSDLAGYTMYNGNCYGATHEQVQSSDLYTINPDGLNYFKEHYHGDKGYKVIYVDSNISTRYSRMVSRGENKGMSFLDAVQSALDRIKVDVHEFYDYTHKNTLVDFRVDNNENDNLEIIADKVYDFICDCERR